MSRLIIISNRLPVSISKHKGNYVYNESIGGVATGISSLSEPNDRLWVGKLNLRQSKRDMPQITSELSQMRRDMS